MTTSSPKTDTPLDPDELCEVCSTKRDEHGDKNHKFSTDGQLVPIEAGAPPRQDPPKLKSEADESPAAMLGRDPVAGLQLRLIELLTQKKVLLGVDLVYLFGGSDENH